MAADNGGLTQPKSPEGALKMEEKNEPSELAKALTLAMNAVAEPINARLDEADARFTVHRYLLEIMYANAFIGNKDGFDSLMLNMLNDLRVRAKSPEPMQADDVIERQVRASTHLDRFRLSVLKRIETDPSR